MKEVASHSKRSIASILLALLLVVGFSPVASADETPSAETLIVRTVRGLSVAEQEAVIQRNGGQITSSIPQLNMYVVEVPAADAEAIALAYAGDAQVASVELDNTRKVEWLPNDELVGGQWHLPKIGWDEVYGNATLNSSGYVPKVAVLDTGINAAHSDLADAVVPGMSVLDPQSDGTTDTNGHGTWLAGIVAAQTDNGEGIAGVAYAGVKVMPVQVIDANGEGQDSDIIEGLIWAADHGADVILMGFSNPGFSENLQAAIDYAWSKDVVLVAAVGNDAQTEPTYPAGDAGVMGVSATDVGDGLAGFSNSGNAVFVAAPGVDITSTDTAQGYSSLDGTSASAAIVAGVAAFMRAVDPMLPNGVIVGRIARNADPAGSADPEEAKLFVGNGRINMPRALADTSMEEVKPIGAPGGGPFVGPYVVANANVTISSASFVWHKTGEVSGGFNVAVAGTYSCNNTGTNCTSVTGITVTVPSVTGSKVITGLSTGVTNAAWTTTLEFRTSPGAGQFAIPADGKYNINALLDTNLTDQTNSANNYFGVDNTAPTTSITCNNAACSGTYTADVGVKLAATDPGASNTFSGVASTLYCVDTANTCTPTTAYPGASGFDVLIAGATTKYVRFFSTDNAGNAETTNSQAISFNTPPSVISTSPSDGATNVAVNSTITVTFSESVVNTGAFSLACSPGPTPAFTVSSSPASSYTLDPTTDLPNSAACTVSINKTKITDEDNAQMANPYSFSFNTAAADTTKPTIGFSQTPDGNNGWFKTSPATVTVTATDASGIASLACKLDDSPVALTNTGSTATTSYGDVTTTDDGDHIVSCEAVDSASPPNTALYADNTTHLKLDTAKPVITASAKTEDTNDYTGGTWTNQSVTVSFTCTDALSGVDTDTVASDNATKSGSGADQSVSSDGECTDLAGNTADTPVEFSDIDIDKVKPVISALATSPPGGAAYTADTWTNDDVEVDFSCTDALSGVDTNDVGDQTVSDEGKTTSVSNTGGCTDNAGNTADTASFGEIWIDKTAPAVAVTFPVNGTTYKPSVYTAGNSTAAGDVGGTSDDTNGVLEVSGVYDVEVTITRLNGATTEYWTGTIWSASETWNSATGTTTWAFLFAEDPAVDPETYTVTAKATDNATNEGTGTAVTFTIAKVATTLLVNPVYDNNGDTTSSFSATLSSSDIACYQNQPVKFYIDLNGDLDFLDAGESLGPFNTNSSGVVNSGTITVVPGTVYDIKAVYEGTVDCVGSNSESTLTVTSPGDSANGGGWYKLPAGHPGSPRVNFGFTVRKVPNTNPVQYKGQILVMNNEQWRIKGNLNDGFGTVASASSWCLSAWGGAACGVTSGTGTLFKWVPALGITPGYWLAKGTVTYTFGFYDGGSSKKGGTKPDYAGLLTITGYTPAGGEVLPFDKPQQLMGGDVKFVAP